MFKSIKTSGRGSPDVAVVGVFTNARGPVLDADLKELDHDGAIAAACARAEFKGSVGSIVEAFPGKAPAGRKNAKKRAGYERVLIVGLGEKANLTPGDLREAAAAAGRKLAAAQVTAAEVNLDAPIAAAKLDAGHAGQCFGEGIGLLAWSRGMFKGSASEGGTEPQALTLKAGSKAFDAGLDRGLGFAEGANLARTLSETPPNICTPQFLIAEARKLARQHAGLSVTVIQGSKLDDEGLVGIKIVGDASENKPALIRFEYTPPRVAKRSKPIVLVGKTMTYDSGGLSIKVGGGMRGMKRDMDGGAAVFGAMHTIAGVVKPNRRVVALLSCAENAISDEAYRPDDILTFRNGVTVEVTNTDAEGRLVLADALCWACDKENPACIVDVATLTGGVVVALGSTYAGLWCDDDGLRGKLEAASEASGERIWRLPHHAEYRNMMKSPVADIWNSAPIREAHPIQGAAFLSYFCDESIPWAHIDIAGTHSTDKDRGMYVAGPTGFGARLLAQFVDAG
ncbi:MAG: leucyl aminopeptidase family protein [Planctomycetota bacterium]